MNEFSQYPESGEFELETETGKIKESNISISSIPTKVFNQDFIDENISFDPNHNCNPIVYVSKEDIESKKQLDKLKTDSAESDKLLEKAI